MTDKAKFKLGELIKLLVLVGVFEYFLSIIRRHSMEEFALVYAAVFIAATTYYWIAGWKDRALWNAMREGKRYSRQRDIDEIKEALFNDEKGQ